MPPTLKDRWITFTQWGLVGLAVSVSLGAALISLLKLWVLVAVLGLLVMQARGAQPPQAWVWRKPLVALMALWAWMVISGSWSDASGRELWTAFDRYSRLLVMPAVAYGLLWTQGHRRVLQGFVAGQALVLVSSLALMAGLPVPWATARFQPELGVVFTSTLEQPIMLCLMALVVWFKPEGVLPPAYARYRWVVVALVMLNVMVLSTGRSGYVAAVLALAWMLWQGLPKGRRAWALFTPVVLMSMAAVWVPQVNERVMQVHRDVTHYWQSETLSETNLGSQGERLNYWARSLDMVQAHPLTGVGMGAWRQHYLSLGGLQQAAPSNPHHQYLLMASEGGLVALALLVAWMALLWQSAATTASPSAMKGVVLLAVVVSLFNCPFYGVGMGEMLLLLFATLLQPRAHQA